MKQVVTTLLFSCFAVFLLAQGPRISVQGTLKDANGVTVDDGTYDLTFRLYPVETGGTAVFEEVGEVTIRQGIYSHLLGSVNTLSPSIFGVTLYLGITVNDVELTPRGELTYAPYSMAVNTAIYADTARFAQNIVGADPCKGAIGDIKYSILPLAQFQSVNGNCWALMDGASLPLGNPLRTLTSVSTIPDARGLFLRGHDDRDAATNQDNDRLTNGLTDVGTFQQDGLVNHTHLGNISSYSDNGQGRVIAGYLPSSNNGGTALYRRESTHVSTMAINGVAETELETDDIRPKNLNFYIYIRIE